MLALLLGACTDASPADEPDPQQLAALSGCGPVTYAEVRGRAPSYGPQRLGRFLDDHAMCAGVWLPGADAWVTPQGLAVAGRTAYVAGFDGTQRGRHRLCTLESVDLGTGRLVRRRHPIAGQVGPREPTECRHGGGVVVDDHGLWLVETQRLWLLDPDTFEVRRVWAVAEPARGSFALLGPGGELGLGRYRAHHPARLWWFDPDALLASASYVIEADDALRTQRVPAGTQGAVYGTLGGVGPGVWFATSVSTCGVLVGPGGRRRAFVPGAEGLALTGPDELWVVSESGSRLYQDRGGRPMTPTIARFDTSDVLDWHRPDCTV